MRLKGKVTFPVYLALFVFLADFASKLLTHLYLPIMPSQWLWYPYGGIAVFKDFFGIEFSLSHQINHGAAWGILADFQIPLLYLRIALITALGIYALFFNTNPQRQAPLALILAGAAGNVVDYFLYGHVVDMLHFVLWGYDFPVFNLADSAIFIGISLLLLLSSLEKRPKARKSSR